MNTINWQNFLKFDFCSNLLL